MRQAASECLSSTLLEPEHEAELRMGFDLLDRDKSGRISLSNLAVLYLKIIRPHTLVAKGLIH
jgi:Ca2+-binding EF-hand superfamily protein